MKNRFLFPHSYRRIGWLLFVPFLVFGLAVLNHDFQFDFLEISFGKSPSPGTFESIFSVNTINLSDEIATLGMILSCNIRLPYKKIVINERQALKANEIRVLYPALPLISKAKGVGV